MSDDQTAPATKEDVRLILESIAASEARTKRHFDVAVETIRHDLLGANADEMTSLDDRVTRLENRVGLAPA